jgi:electron transfer flavoprotein beta subunit
MQIVVCVKQVPRDNSVRIDPQRRVDAAGIEPIINLFDEYALEEGIGWGERLGCGVTALALGGEDWIESLRRALAMGASDALLLRDAAFAELDTLAAARVAAAAIRRLGDVRLILAGRNSTDDESGAFGPMLARLLGWPQLTYVGKIGALDEAAIHVERHLERSVEHVTAQLPAVVTVVKDINAPRYPSLLKIKKASRAEIPTWGAAELGLGAAELAPAAELLDRELAPPRPAGQIVEGGDSTEKVRRLADALERDGLI